MEKIHFNTYFFIKSWYVAFCRKSPLLFLCGVFLFCILYRQKFTTQWEKKYTAQSLSVHILSEKCGEEFTELLGSLQNSPYGVSLTVHMLMEKDQKGCKEANTYFTNLQWKSGEKKVVTYGKEAELRSEWVRNVDQDGPLLVFHQDVLLVHNWDSYLISSLERYRCYKNFAGIVEGTECLQNSQSQSKPSENFPFLAANPRMWQSFLKWSKTQRLVGSSEIPRMWCADFLDFCSNHNYYVLLARLTTLKKSSLFVSEIQKPEVVPIGTGDKPTDEQHSQTCNTTWFGSRSWGGHLPGKGHKLKNYLPKNSVVYIIGDADVDLEFETQLVERLNLTLHMFPSSVKQRNKVREKMQKVLNQVKILPWGITAEEDESLEFYSPNASTRVSVGDSGTDHLSELRTLRSTMKSLNHTYIDVLKINHRYLNNTLLNYIIKYRIFPRMIITSAEIYKGRSDGTDTVLMELDRIGYTPLSPAKKGVPGTFILEDCAAEPFVHKARQIASRWGYVNVQVFNYGFLTMTKSWICNVRPLKNVLAATLFIVSDVESYRALVAMEDVNVVLVEYNTQRNMDYGTKLYYSFTQFRTVLIMKLLKRGISVWSTESDATWFASPFDDMDNSSDLLIFDNQSLSFSGEVSVGMIFLRACKHVIQLWADLLAWRVTKQENPGNLPEQKYLTELVKKTKARVRWMFQWEYVSGQWYGSKYLQSMHRSGFQKVIQNNFIINNANKMDRAKKFGHWFLKDDGTCK